MDQSQAAQFVQYVKAGDKAQAMRLLAAVLRQNPQDEQAWLAMAQITDGEQQKDCLKRVLAISPNNPYVLRQLQASRASPTSVAKPAPRAPLDPPRAPLPSASASFSLPETPASPPPPPLASRPATAPQSKVAPARRAAESISPWLIIAGGMICLIGLVGIIGVGWLIVNQGRQAASIPIITVAPTRVPLQTFPPTWTPAPPPTETATRQPTPQPEVATATAAAATESVLGRQPASAPKSLANKIAYTVGDNLAPGQIYLSDGSNAGVQASSGAADGRSRYSVWRPDGKIWFLAVKGSPAGADTIYEVEADGSGLREVLSGVQMSDSQWAVSPDGKTVAYVESDMPNRKQRLKTIDLATKQQKTLREEPENTYDSKTQISTHFTFSVSDWSPDGKKILFTNTICMTQQGTSCDRPIYTISPAGGEPQLVASGAGGVLHPRFSPDSQQIVFSFEPPDDYSAPVWGMAMVDVDGSNPRVLTLDGNDNLMPRWPDWSPDGKSIVFSGGNVFVIPAACFDTPHSCALHDALRLPFTGNEFDWRGGPPTSSGAAPAPTIPPVTPAIPLESLWEPVATFTGENAGKTALFKVAKTGNIRVSWTNEPVSGGQFAISLLKPDVLVVEDLARGVNAGAVVHFVLVPGNYQIGIDSQGQWTVTVEFKPDSRNP